MSLSHTASSMLDKFCDQEDAIGKVIVSNPTFSTSPLFAVRDVLTIASMLLGAWMIIATGPPSRSAEAAPPPDRCVDDYLPPEARRDPDILTARGLACFQSEKYARALHYYRRAFQLSQDPLLEAVIGRSMHELGLWGAAKAYYERYLARAADKDGAGCIRERLAELEHQLGTRAATVTVQTSPSATHLWLETETGHREDLGNAPMTTRLAPGTYTLVVERIGYYPARETIDLALKAQETVEVELVPQGATFNIPSRRLRRIGAVTLTASTLTLAAGGFTALSGDRPWRPLGHGLLFVGSAGLITGSVTSLIGARRDGAPPSLKPAEDRNTSPKTSVMPQLGIGRVGISVSF